MITLSPQYTQRTCTWDRFKTLTTLKSLSVQCDEDDEKYLIWGYDGPEVYLTTIWKIVIADSILASGITQEQNDLNLIDFESNYKATSNSSIVKKTSDGRTRISNEKSTNARANIYSHNWCDPTTWYQCSQYVLTESITFTSGSPGYYQLAHANVIDTYHGKLTGEDFLKDSSNRSYRVSVKADSATLSEQNPHYGTGGDYTIDYSLGRVYPVLQEEFTGSVVTATYHYAGSSAFTFKPATGKTLTISHAEVQFSEDIIITDTVSVQPYGDVAYFAPQLLGVYPSGTLIPLGNPVVYKTFLDYLNESLRGYPKYQAFGGPGWRGTQKDTILLDWDYISAQVLYSHSKMQVTLKLDHDCPYSGSYATTTFYCIVDDC